MLKGSKSMFCGFDDEADFKLNKNHLKWANVIILLDKNIKREKIFDTINSYVEEHPYTKKTLEYFIEDNPETFNKIYPKLVMKVNNLIT